MKLVMRSVSLLLVSSLARCFRPTLWPGTTAGMPLAEVQKAFPDAREPDNAAELPAGGARSCSRWTRR